MGAVGSLMEFPVFSKRNETGGNNIRNNPAYDSPNLADDLNIDGSGVMGSELANLYHEQVAFTCGDCHLGSAGANNRYGDFRSSGCTACHMPYSLDGRSRSGDPNVNQLEPLNPDNIDEPEQPHIARHMIRSVAQNWSMPRKRRRSRKQQRRKPELKRPTRLTSPLQFCHLSTCPPTRNRSIFPMVLQRRS